VNGCSGAQYDEILGGICDLLSRCPDLYPLAYSNRDQCKAILCWASTCHIDTKRVGNDIDFTLQQTMPSVQPSAVQSCLDYLKTVTCEEGLGANNPCGDVLGGSSSSSSNNNGTSECSSATCPTNSYCQYGAVNVDLGVRTCSTCQPKRQLGERCGQAECVDGLYCDDHFESSSFTCIAPAPDGTACYSNSPNHSPCQSGFCNFRTLMCDPAGKEGDPCTSSSDCRDSHCNSMMKCEKLHAAGEACTADGDCANFTCDATAHTCGLVDGSACMQFGGRACAGFCDPLTNTCSSPKALGAVCTNDSECQTRDCTQTSFSSSTRTCQVRCDDSTPCMNGQVCAGFGYCKDPQPTGASCEDDDECQSGRCGSNETCVDKPKIGGTCMDSGDCFPIGYCHGGSCERHKGPGSVCDAYDSCLVPYICLTGTCSLLNLSCVPAQAGSQCTLLHVCDDQSYCDLAANFTCKPRVGAGAMCGSDGQCNQTLFCQNGMCAPRLGAGSACTSDSQCQEGTFCVPGMTSSMGTCTAAPSGQPCDSFDNPCPDGWFCPDRRCVAGTAQVGESCSSFQTGCVAGLYCNGSMCQEREPIGQQCFDDGACLSGHCDRSVDVCLLSDMCL